MSDLRDARLAKALAHAPDAQDAPTVVTRDAIRKIAVNAIDTRANRAVAPQVSWWKALWVQSGRRTGPWPAAFATVVLGVSITLLWNGREPTDERSPRSVARAPQPGPGSGSVPAPVAAAGDQSAGPADNAVAAKSGAATTAPPPAAPAPAPAPTAKVVRPSPQAEVAAVQAVSPHAVLPAAPAEPAVAEPTPARPAPPPTLAEAAPASNLGTSSDKAMRDAVPARQRAAVAPAPAAGTGTLGRLVAPGVEDWTAADLTYSGRSSRLTRLQAQALVSRVQALVASAPAEPLGAVQGASLLRLQVLGSSGALATFELWANGYRWQRAGQTDVSGPLRADDVSGLQALAARAMLP